MAKNPIYRCFPLKEYPRPQQVKAFELILKAFKEGKTTVVLQAPTGSGKSAIALALSKFMKTSWVLTPRVQLQKQYTESFPDLVYSAGKDHLTCPLSGLPASEADCVFKRCPKDFVPSKDSADPKGDYEDFYKPYLKRLARSKGWTVSEQVKFNFVDSVVDMGTTCEGFNPSRLAVLRMLHRASFCPYYNYRNRILENPISCLNHGILAMRVCQDSSHWGFYKEFGNPTKEEALKVTHASEARFLLRNLLVVDEMHHLDSIGRWLGDLEFTSYQLALAGVDTRFPKSFGKDPNKYRDYLYEKVAEKAIKSSAVFGSMLKKYSMMNIMTSDERVAFSGLVKAKREIDTLIDSINHLHFLDESEYMVEFGRGVLKLRCLNPQWLLKHYLFDTAKHKLLMSATTGDPQVISEELGLDPNTTEFISLDDDFNYMKSPILIKPKVDLRKISDQKAGMKKLAKEIVKIVEGHVLEKGLVHFTSYDQIKQMEALIVDPAVKSRLLFHTLKRDLPNLLKEYQDSDDCVLLSPSVQEGIDLPDDQCRFIVLAKLPWSPLNSHVDRFLARKYPKRYVNKMLQTMVQSIGRGVRNNHDWCKTYILDFKSPYWLGRCAKHPLVSRIASRLN
jgi:Rad3-related DNA helicase